MPAADLRIELGESDRDEPPAFEPFDALVGPVRIDESGVVAGVIPEERFAELRALLDVVGAGPPLVVFARSDGTHAYEPIEAVASEAVVVSTVVAVP